MPATARTVLLVEDDNSVRAVVREVVESEGFQVIEAENGRIALDHLLAGLRPCLVLLDLMMPVMNGFEFLGEVAARPALRSIPVVIVSAGMRETVRETARTSGAVGYIFKPIELDTLIAAIHKFGSAA